MTKSRKQYLITITQTPRGTRIEASGVAALQLLDAMANGAPTPEAAAWQAWISGGSQKLNPNEVNP
ncbi:hypothetical protein [Pandoraea apista]|uniref:Uncharacterized protein n=1 Tax=Pandoraea apista TaxID=93218 RepID=A0A5E5P7C4_9BURK|nr:hypothetical protein [Pandoraea apista]VVG72115.1 hypothetical protein PAP18089_03108 [Pandoraea apista]